MAATPSHPRRLRAAVATLATVLLGSAAAAQVPLELYRDSSFPTGLGLGESVGISFGDVDGDGWVDIHANVSGNLWRNEGGTTWTLARRLNAGLALEYGSSFGDFNNDGLVDLATEPRTMSCFRLFENRGEFSFVDIAGNPVRVPAAPCTDASETACWADVDGDGYLDLFLPTYPPQVSGGVQGNYFWHNLGPIGPGGEYRFAEISQSIGLQIPAGFARPEGAQFCDYDCDGDVDLYSNSAIYQNVSTPGKPMFQRLPPSTSGIRITSILEEGAAFVDYDFDGDFDLLVSYTIEPGVVVWENRGDGSFFLDQSTITNPLVGNDFGLSIADWDNDGDLDFTTHAVFRANQLIETGRRGFSTQLLSAPPSHLSLPAFAWADVDRDGDLDAAIGNFDQATSTGGHLYVNTTYDESTPQSARRYVRVRPVADSPNSADGLENEFGASVVLRVAGENLERRQFTASSNGYLNQNEYALHFGLQAQGIPFAPSRFDLSAEFPTDSAGGLWRVDGNTNPVLSDISLDSLRDRQITVFRSGRVLIDGADVVPQPGTDPVVTTTAGGLARGTATQGLPKLTPAPANCYIGIEVDVGKAPVSFDELVFDGVLATDQPFNIAIWDFTNPEQPTIEATFNDRSSARNRRQIKPLSFLAQANHRYRVAARIVSYRASSISAPMVSPSVTTRGGLLYTALDPTSGTEAGAAVADNAQLYAALRVRTTQLGVPIDLGNGIPDSSGTTAQMSMTAAIQPNKQVLVQISGAPARTAAIVLAGTQIQLWPLPGRSALVPGPQLRLSGILQTDHQGKLQYRFVWPPGLPRGTRLAFQVWYAAAGRIASSNLMFVAAP